MNAKAIMYMAIKNFHVILLSLLLFGGEASGATEKNNNKPQPSQQLPEEVNIRLNDLSSKIENLTKTQEANILRILTCETRIDELSKGIDRCINIVILAITIIAAVLTFMGIYATAISYFTFKKSRDDARIESEKWFKENEIKIMNRIDEELKGAIEHIENMKNCAKGQADEIAAIYEKMVNIDEISSEDKKEIAGDASRLSKKTFADFTVNDWFVKGISAYENSDYSKAATYFDRITTLKESSNIDVARALLFKGASLSRLGKTDEAIDIFKEIFRHIRNETDKNQRNIIAASCFNIVTSAGHAGQTETADEYLGKLRALVKTWPEDAAVREKVAMALVNTGVAAKEANDRQRRDVLLDELRALVKAWPEDAAVRESLANALLNTTISTKKENDMQQRDELVDELRALAKAWPDDAAVRENLATALFNTGNDPKNENNPTRRDALLDELLGLAKAWPEDVSVRERVTKALVNAGVAAKDENDLQRRDALLDELRVLAKTWPEDAVVRKQVAMALANTVIDAKDENDLRRRDALLDELRTLARTWPEDAAVREQFAKALVNTSVAAKDENDLQRRDALLDELRDLAKAWPKDTAVRENLAGALLNTIIDAKAENDLQRRDVLLEELRTLAKAWPDDTVVMGIVSQISQVVLE